MSAIPCASVSLKTMMDGTLIISFDSEPMHAQDAFRLFAAPGTPAAIAALAVGYATAKPTTEESSAVEKPKGGPLSELAGMWCNDPEFWAWINRDHGPMWIVENIDGAAMFVRDMCRISSRAKLDHDEIAAEKFHRLIRGPYSKYMQARGAI